MKQRFFARLRAGLTLAETLIALAVLALFSLTAATVATTTLGTRTPMVQAGNAPALASTALFAVADEIRFGKEVRVEDGSLILNSENFGRNAVFELKNGRIYVTCGEKGDAVSTGSVSYELLTEKYYGGLYFQSLTFTPDKEKNAVTIGITVCSNGKSDPIYSTSMTVAALNA